MTMTLQEIEELKDQLFDAATALEEMVVYQEGKMPERVLQVQREQSYADARKVVLNDARSQLRRTKTYLLRAGVLRNKTSEVSLDNNMAGTYNATVEKSNGTPPLPHPPTIKYESNHDEERILRAILALGAIMMAIFSFHFAWIGPVVIIGAAGVFALWVIYAEIVGVK